MIDPAKIVAKGIFADQPIEDFKPVWDCAPARIARSAWVDCGIDIFLRADVPYGATSSGRLSDDAVRMLLETPKRDHAYRFLEIGAGSGIFAKIFLDILKTEAPEIYANCTYTLTDGNLKMLESQAEYGVLADHADHVEALAFDASKDFPDHFTAAFDAVFGSYILDSLPAAFLMVGESGAQQMVARGMLPEPDPTLIEALKKPGFAHLGPYLPIAKLIALQTRHTPAADLPFADAIDPDEGEDHPMVHSYGALRCMENIAKSLRPDGFAMLTDYGTLHPREPSETMEFQNFGESAAYAMNFYQVDRYFADHPMAYLKPEAEEGHLITRVLYNGDAEVLAESVDLLFGEVRQRALRLPIDAARDLLRANAFHAARHLYVKAMDLQPKNWALAEEVAELLLLGSKNYSDAIELCDFGLGLNPYAPNLHRIKAESYFELGQIDLAEKSLADCFRCAGNSAYARILEARIRMAAGDYKDALIAVAKALGDDHEAEHREALTNLQSEILHEVSVKARDNLMAEVNRTRLLDGLPL